LGPVERRGRVDYSRAIHGGSLLSSCDEDGGRGLLEASNIIESYLGMYPV